MKPPILIDSAEGIAYLHDIRRTGHVVALLGSGISIWHPSNMPNGQRITDALADVIATSTISPRSTFIDRIKNTAFEHIMERYPKAGVLRSIVAHAFYPTPPNPVHEAFASLLKDGVIKHVITTNYDVGLEAACAAIGGPTNTPQVIVTEDDVPASGIMEPVLFKIHGCAAPGNNDSIVLTLRGEGEMPRWKREILRTLINGNHLLVCGYSGLDFEICPELMHLSPAGITWNCFGNPAIEGNALTANARRVLDAAVGTPLVGDMNKMLQVLTGRSWSADFSRVSPDFVNELVRALDSWELDKWRVWVMNGLSCALDGVHVARRMYTNSGGVPERQMDSLLALGESLFHSGFYKQAAHAYRSAARLASADGDWENILRAEVGVIESDRVAGRWLRARRRIRKLARTLPDQTPPEERERMVSEITLKRVLLRRYPFYLSKLLHLRPLTNRIRRQAKSELAEASASFARQGSWFNLQHCEMLAAKFGVRFSEVYTGPMMPLAARDGYRQLGYILAEIMAYRTLLADSTVSDPPFEIEYFRIARELGINAEVWKLARAFEKRFGFVVPPSGSGAGLALPLDFRRDAQTAWRACEYTLPMRLLLRLRGEDA